MGIKITVDNNFFDNYDKHPIQEDKKLIISAFRRKYFSFYPTPEVLAELLGIYSTRRKPLLIRYSKILLSMVDYRIFNYWSRIIRHDLGLLENESIFLGSKETEYAKSIFGALANGRKPKNIEEILNLVKQEKEDNYKKYKATQKRIFNKFKDEKITVPKMSFDEFYNDKTIMNMRRDLIRYLFLRAGKSVSDEKTNKITDTPRRYPYFSTSSRVFMALFYRYVVLGRGVREGDHYDQYYLIYLTDLDYLVSNDLGLKELAKDVFGGSDKIIDFDGLVGLAKQ
ncbi:MAG: hypothetical protein GY858_09475 [Candidatus Omnitrophica bacterium]|nr:hypothetical protein [Candidatus Omnitrophota bacterium]